MAIISESPDEDALDDDALLRALAAGTHEEDGGPAVEIFDWPPYGKRPAATRNQGSCPALVGGTDPYQE